MATKINGYQMTTTFWEDFSIAERFGIKAIKDTFRRAVKEWEDDPTYMAEVAIVTNTKCWMWYQQGKEALSRLYSDLYYKVRDIVYDDNKERPKDYYSIFFRLKD